MPFMLLWPYILKGENNCPALISNVPWLNVSPCERKLICALTTDRVKAALAVCRYLQIQQNGLFVFKVVNLEAFNKMADKSVCVVFITMKDSLA